MLCECRWCNIHFGYTVDKRNTQDHDYRMRHTGLIDFREFSQEQLEAIQEALADRLPPKTLLDVNLEHELLGLMRKGQTLLSDVLTDDAVPANQRAQVLNSLASTLDQLAKLQNSIYDSERIKRLEHVFTRTLKALPSEAAEYALETYRGEWKKQFQ